MSSQFVCFILLCALLSCGMWTNLPNSRKHFWKLLPIVYWFLCSKEFIGIRAEDEATEEIDEGTDLTGPYFDANIPINVTAIVGKSAFLRCRVRNLSNKTVSLLAKNMKHLLRIEVSLFLSFMEFLSILFCSLLGYDIVTFIF